MAKVPKFPKTPPVKAPKVPTPRNNPMGSHPNPRGFPRAVLPRPKPINTRIYTKQAANQDPSQFTGFGFGDTGDSGES